MRKKKKFNLKSKITSALRKVWRYSPPRQECLKRCETGEHYIVYSKKTKKPYKRPYLKCESCKDVFKKLQVDHIEPVVDYIGFQGWDTYIQRLNVESTMMRAICKDCHTVITLLQKEKRKKYKKPLAKKKK